MNFGVDDIKMLFSFMDGDNSSSVSFLELADQLWKMKHMVFQ